MSDSENTKTSVSFELLICSDPMALPFPIRRGADSIYDELRELSELLPARHGDLFRHRWGLDSHFPHMTEQTATKFDIPKNTVQRMLNQSLWNIARYAHYRELPGSASCLATIRPVGPREPGVRPTSGGETNTQPSQRPSFS